LTADSATSAGEADTHPCAHELRACTSSGSSNSSFPSPKPARALRTLRAHRTCVHPLTLDPSSAGVELNHHRWLLTAPPTQRGVRAEGRLALELVQGLAALLSVRRGLPTPSCCRTLDIRCTDQHPAAPLGAYQETAHYTSLAMPCRILSPRRGRPPSRSRRAEKAVWATILLLSHEAPPLPSSLPSSPTETCSMAHVRWGASARIKSLRRT
jgi:hypothetical protein